MALNFAVSPIVNVFGSKNIETNIIDDTVALTTNFADNRSNVISVKGMSKINLEFEHTGLLILEVVVESTNDSVNFFQLTNISNADNVSTIFKRDFQFTGAGLLSFPIDIASDSIRVSVRETLTGGGTLFMQMGILGQ